MSPGSLDELLARARLALAHAHAPYSRFEVGAAVRDEWGRIHVGVNVENVSYGLTVCAERAAIFAAVASGARRVTAVAVTSRRLHPIAPCGACRQVILEFADAATPVVSDDDEGRLVTSSAGDLLPGAFLALDPSTP